MAISKKNKMIQVKVSKSSYEFLKTFSDMFDVSISNFCEDSIVKQILEIGKMKDEDIKKLGLFIKQTYKNGERSK